MSILTKILKPIIKPIILQEIKKSMDKYLPQLIGLVEKYGTKFLVALGGNYFVYDLANKDKIEGIYAAGIIGAISIAYFLVRRWQEVGKQSNGTTQPRNNDKNIALTKIPPNGSGGNNGNGDA